MNNILAIGWTTEDLTEVIAQCNNSGISITTQYGSENLSSSISKDFGLIIINGTEHIATHKKIAPLLHNCGVETVVFSEERQNSDIPESEGSPHVQRTAPLTLGKIKQCLKNKSFRNEKRLYEQSSLGDFKQFLKLFQKSVSHELNTPINVIKASLHILENHRSKLNEKEITEQINYISNSTERLERLISDIRFDMDLTNKSTKPNIGILNINQAVENATTSLFDKKRITKQPSAKPIYALADSHLLSQAIVRVAQNGLENSEEQIKIRINESDSWIRIDISDTGDGIDQELSESIFEPFTRYGDENGKQGIGLGLTIAKKCMTAMRGRIDFTSEIGRGTTFSLHLPAVTTVN